MSFLRRSWLLTLFILLVVLCSVAAGQPSTSQETQPDIVTHETTTFKVRVNQVLMRVVVTDAHGTAVGNLTKDNFQVLDNGKPQPIASFSVVGRAVNPVPTPTPMPPVATVSPKQPVREVAPPEQYFAYLFDDLHISIEDLMSVRNAARKHMMNSLNASDRAAVFTTSGRLSLDFTDDRKALGGALDKIHALKESEFVRNPCPFMNYYTADRILNKMDHQALQAVMMDVMERCGTADLPTYQQRLMYAKEIAEQTAERELTKGDVETTMSLSVLRDVMRDLASRPGQKTLVLVSPGFLAESEHLFEVSEDLDKALRANIVINTLDARGLWVDPTWDASLDLTSLMSKQYFMYIENYIHGSAREAGNVLGELADGTGGVWFHDNNDLQEGFRRTATTPEYVYLIAFTPQSLKYDGKFHNLKVVLKSVPVPNLTARTRKGYFAPKVAESAAAQAQSDIEDAVFSRDERQDIPVDLHTEFFRAQNKANVAVVTHVDLRPLQFRKDGERNLNTLTVVSALFDRNGRYIAGQEKRIDFHMRDEVLQLQMRKGIAVKSSFAVDPGDYMVRVVVRDAEGEMLSSKNDTVNIPYD